MKKLPLLFALLFCTLFAFGQKSKTVERELSKFELQVSPGSFIVPKLTANVYLKENTLLRITAPTISLGSVSRMANGDRFEFETFLEFREPLGGKYFLSHGPAIGYINRKAYSYEDGNRVHSGKIGYNFGAGMRIGERAAVGTYIDPYISFGNNGVNVLHGRLFAGALTNVYMTYRF